MNEYCEILEHRVRQFTWYLRLMRARQRRMSRGNSFIIFEEKLRDTPGDGNVLVESKAKVLQAGTWHDSADDGIRGALTPPVPTCRIRTGATMIRAAASSSSFLIPGISTSISRIRRCIAQRLKRSCCAASDSSTSRTDPPSRIRRKTSPGSTRCARRICTVTNGLPPRTWRSCGFRFGGSPWIGGSS